MRNLLLLLIICISCGGGTSQEDEIKHSESSTVTSSEESAQGKDLIQGARWFFNESSFTEFFSRHPNDEERLKLGERINITSSQQSGNTAIYNVRADFSSQNLQDLNSYALVVGHTFNSKKIKNLEWRINTEPGMIDIPADHTPQNEQWIIRIGTSQIFRDIINQKSVHPFGITLKIETETGIHFVCLELKVLDPLPDLHFDFQSNILPMSSSQLATTQNSNDGINVFQTVLKNNYKQRLFYKILWKTPFVLSTFLRETSYSPQPHSPPQKLPDQIFKVESSYRPSFYQVVRYKDGIPFEEPMKPYLNENTPLIEIQSDESVTVKWYVSLVKDQNTCSMPGLYSKSFGWVEKRRQRICEEREHIIPVRGGRDFSVKPVTGSLLMSQDCYDGPIDDSLDVHHSQNQTVGFSLETSGFSQELEFDILVFRFITDNNISKKVPINTTLLSGPTGFTFHSGAPLYAGCQGALVF